MFGKIAGAWLGEKVAGPNSGAKGAFLGYAAVVLARRSIPALAAVTAIGWAGKKLWQRRQRGSAYPSDATPSS